MCLHVNWIAAQRMWPVIATVLLKLKDFPRSQAVTYMVKVVMSRKQCNIETFLLQIANRKWHMANWIVAIPMTLTDLQGHAPNKGLLKWFLYICAAVNAISTDVASRGPYAITEPFVVCIFLGCCAFGCQYQCSQLPIKTRLQRRKGKRKGRVFI